MGGFVDYLRRLSQHVLEQAPSSLEELAEQDWSAARICCAWSWTRF